MKMKYENITLSTTTLTETSSTTEQYHHQSLPLCILFASISGILRVIATMILAYPDYLVKRSRIDTGTTNHDINSNIIFSVTNNSNNENNNHHNHHPIRMIYYIGLHLLILTFAAIMSIIGTMYGPVSIFVPVQTGVSLLCNVIAMGIILQMRAFNKAQRTGTYILFFSILSLIDVGPAVQEEQDAAKLLSHPMAIIWTTLITAFMVYAAIGTIILVLARDEATILSTFTTSTGLRLLWFQKHSTFILALGTTMSNVGMATSSKSFGSVNGTALTVSIIYYMLATILGILFSIVSSTTCDQGIFTPLSCVTLIVTNMITGLIIWEDWKVIDTWIAYICACLLMCCGVYLLAEVDLMEHFSRSHYANIVVVANDRELSISRFSITSSHHNTDNNDDDENASLLIVSNSNNDNSLTNSNGMVPPTGAIISCSSLNDSSHYSNIDDEQPLRNDDFSMTTMTQTRNATIDAWEATLFQKRKK
jgi:hypothetical protein